ncbi:MAG: glycoside hydrolase family 3 C-terminal domain-containing protein [Clostridia bacterium]|nr:glycoside hydrolase family 3 C-terminal domain-containing protein [Clostridia bacterium]
MNYSMWINQMTLREQVSFLSGDGMWHTQSNDRLVIPSLAVCDGPNGLRKTGRTGKAEEAVCFPSPSAMASSWDTAAMQTLGETLGSACRSKKVSVLLGPGINIKRSPLCGRNFEYFSEDPLLNGTLATAYIDGVQSQGVGASLKHFAVNSTDDGRMMADAIVDERALRELYLRGFELAVKNAKPWTVMAAYNKINGKPCTENSRLLQEILREEWGFDGLVVSDWGAVYDRVAALKAGVDLEMPGTGNYSNQKLMRAYHKRDLDQVTMHNSIKRVFDLIQESIPALQEFAPALDLPADHDRAVALAKGCPVLLKNEGGVLPIRENETVAVIGRRAVEPRYQGGGSSAVNAHNVVSPFDALKEAHQKLTYADGYDLADLTLPNHVLLDAAVTKAKAADKVLVFVSASEFDVCEGFDRKDLSLPAAMTALLDKVAAANPNVAVVLMTGSSVEMPWADNVGGILQAHLLGEGVGEALASILTGKTSPSGKLTESYPYALEDLPYVADLTPDKDHLLRYRESIFVGYRYYQKAGKPVRFPFGHGLSYTSFDYSDLHISDRKFALDDKLTVRFTLRNTGLYPGAEVPQLYVAFGRDDSFLYRPLRELKAYTKVELAPGESRTVTLELDRSAFEYFSAEKDRWQVEPGDYDILIGSSSEDLRLRGSVSIDVPDFDEVDYRAHAPEYYAAKLEDVTDERFYDILGYDLDEYRPAGLDRRITKDSCLNDAAEKTKAGRMAKNAVTAVARHAPLSQTKRKMLEDGILNAPLSSFARTSRGLVSDNVIDGIAYWLDGGRGIDAGKLAGLGLVESAENVVLPWMEKYSTRTMKRPGILDKLDEKTREEDPSDPEETALAVPDDEA